MNIWIIIRGIESVKWLENWAAPLVILIGLSLLYWGVSRAGGWSATFSEETVARVRGKVIDYDFWKIFFPLLTGMVGFWATLSLNIPDFTRYARSQRDQILGQAISLPTTMALFSFIGIAVTASTVVIFGEPIWDPVVLVSRFESPLLVAIGLCGLLVSTLSCNLAANVVSPANDFSNLRPDKISFRTGGLITGVIGIVIMPWRLVSDLGAYIYTWLIGYSALLGSVAGVMLADYYLLRKTKLSVDALYEHAGEYSYGGSGYNWRAITALIIGAIPSLPGFLQQASNGAIQVAPIFNSIYTYAWFVGVLVSGATHIILTNLFPLGLESRKTAAANI